ncbi:2-oxoglutarate and iron-dependent oxygenase domain-containing protein 2-like isoform X2 [Stegodyphus dumicola]|uniref:2-oxoglutarate and iron-dependent oxygenase domain-containing protein 2-like isoform X2 n=1 Tax=Stegodyphus dumicola TaxID=202533 RepID=UPI0015AC3FA1|nr:2-oxoglutarate and iron-dependent oxygenase domain-containing protein 2-like isoform X2 [Stegodyphus dumicola]
MQSFYTCSCYYTHNIYIKRCNYHFTFIDENQFCKDYKEIHEEISRRKQAAKNSLKRKEIIKKCYKPLNSSLYRLEEIHLASSFLTLVQTAKNFGFQKTLQTLDVISEEKQLYGFQVFKENFCLALLDEIAHYEESNLPKERPNTMNKYGVLLDELGFHDEFSCILRVKYLDTLAAVLFPEWRGKGLDSHKIFTVGYKIGHDVDLSYHFDNCEVTLNVCLSKNFKGGELYFGDMKDVPIDKSSCMLVPHKVGYGILHRGQQLHGALPISAGERHNLIFWMRSSSIRNKKCPMCNSKPLLVACNDYGDGFTQDFELSNKHICNIT